MKYKIKLGVKSVNRLAGGLMLISLIGFIIPVVILCGFGLYFIIANDFLIYFSGMLLLSTLFFFIPVFFGDKVNRKNKDDNDIVIEASSDWSDVENKIWNDINVFITNKIDQGSNWSDLKGQSLEVADKVAKEFGKKGLDFNILEGLQLLEEISRRYRKVLNENVPASDLIKVSQLKNIYGINSKHGEKIKSLWSYGSFFARSYSMLNPPKAIVDEIRKRILTKTFERFSKNLQYNSKRALLQEVAKVSIDLYSGRYTIEHDNINPSKISKQDKTREVQWLEPVRVTLVGQISSGKSSLVNALRKDMNTEVAEVDILPSTNNILVYRYIIEGEEQLNIIDIQGLDGNEKTLINIVEQITQSDLVLWVLKANQSSRQLDIDLKNRVDEFYLRPENISLKKPKILGVLNQIDKLNPSQSWTPPYTLNDISNPKTINILAAIKFNSKLLDIDEIYPVGIPQGDIEFGIEPLKIEIQKKCDQAKMVQLNRQRHEAKRTNSLKEQGSRLFKSSKKILKNSIVK